MGCLLPASLAVGVGFRASSDSPSAATTLLGTLLLLPTAGGATILFYVCYPSDNVQQHELHR